jgi:hypothetical protein
MVPSSSPHLGATDSHNTWTTTRGSPHIRPELKEAADEIVSLAIAIHDDAIGGRIDAMAPNAGRLRQLTDALRHRRASE